MFISFYLGWDFRYAFIRLQRCLNGCPYATLCIIYLLYNDECASVDKPTLSWMFERSICRSHVPSEGRCQVFFRTAAEMFPQNACCHVLKYGLLPYSLRSQLKCSLRKQATCSCRTAAALFPQNTCCYVPFEGSWHVSSDQLPSCSLRTPITIFPQKTANMFPQSASWDVLSKRLMICFLRLQLTRSFRNRLKCSLRRQLTCSLITPDDMFLQTAANMFSERSWHAPVERQLPYSLSRQLAYIQSTETLTSGFSCCCHTHHWLPTLK